ncbi:MAG: hypothetical protein HY996_01960 [Micrococcales bacterium]|nr:hypothetical protein [Micrococcales bacterium]
MRDPDPLVALPVLLRTRDRCLRDQDPRCLIAVDEPGSPAAVVDTAAIAAGSAPVLSAAGARTVQLLGGVTIIETGDPPVRIALIRRADGGWRLRDLPTAAVG